MTAAFVDIGDGAHTPQVRFTAPDSTPAWNGYPVAVAIDLLGAFDPAVTYSHALLRDMAMPVDEFTYLSTTDDWLPIDVPNYRTGLLHGYNIESRLHGEHVGADGSLGLGSPAGGAGSSVALPGPGTPAHTPFDSGWMSAGGPGCAACVTDLQTFGGLILNLSGSGGIYAGSLVDLQWAGSGVPLTAWAADQVLGVTYVAPGSPGAGLVVHVATDHCGVVTTTWAALAAYVSAHTPVVCTVNAFGTEVPGAQDAGVMGGAPVAAVISFRGGVAE